MIRSDYSMTDPASAATLPAPLRLRPTFPFVGRPRELALLRSLLPREAGRQVALLGGEPGAGKSRLVREFAHSAADEGALVLYGASDAVVRTPYRPVVEALEHLVRMTEPELLRDDLGESGGELTRLLPDLDRRAGPLPAPLAADQDTERHRLHTAVTTLLVNAGRRQPLLVVFEDNHWADTPTLLLIRHLSRAAAEARMLLLATFRDVEADVPAELADTLVELRRSEGVVPIRLGGLSAGEVEDFVSRATGSSLDEEQRELAASITDLTGGNPFLLTELWRALIETGVLELAAGSAHLTRPLAEVATPDSVRELVSQRLSRLRPGTVSVLELAAVIGPEFEIEVLRSAGAADDPAVLQALDEGSRTGMIEEATQRALAYRFSHDLVRRALYDRLSVARRAELHLRVGEALEQTTEGVSPAAELAYHFAAAAPLGDRDRAVGYLVRAADDAVAALSFDQAAALYRRAIELNTHDATRAEIEIRLGTASYKAGKTTDALDAFRAAATTARRLGSPDLLAQAAVGFEKACWRPGIVDQGAGTLLEEAAAALGAEDSGRRVEVLVGLAVVQSNRGDHARSTLIREEAAQMARRIGDRRALSAVLMRAYWARGTTDMRDVLEMLTEAHDLAVETGDVETRAEAIEWRIAARMSIGDLDAAKADLALADQMGSAIGQPFIQHVSEHYAAALALCDGRLADAEAAADRSHQWSVLMTGREPSAVHGMQLFSIRREQGRLTELAPVVRVLAQAESGGAGAWRPGMAALFAELGMHQEARRELDQVRASGLAELRRSLWIASLTYLTDACTAVGDAELAAELYPELEPHSGTNVMIGHGVLVYGSADRYLAMLAATAGDSDRAAGHFEQALELNRRMGADTWLAHTAHQYGRLLLARGKAGDGALADELLAEAARLAERIGMPTLRARVAELGPMPPATATPPPDGLSPREVEILRLVARGLSNREIGLELSISEHTAANHIRSILRKTGCANRTEAATYAHTQGLTTR